MENKGNLTLRDGHRTAAGTGVDPLGWILGLARGFARRLTLDVALDEECSFGVHCHTSDTIYGFPVHKTAIMLAARLTNHGNVPLTIRGYSLGYRQTVRGQFFKAIAAALRLKDLGWPLPLDLSGNSETSQSGGNGATLSLRGADGSAFYLGAGQTCEGTLYFEGKGQWHDTAPRLLHGKMYVRLHIVLEDGESLSRGFWIKAAPQGAGRALSADFGTVRRELEAG